jgi:hypothetical protein
LSDNGIYQVNEVAALKRRLEGPQKTWPRAVVPNAWGDQTVADTWITTTGLNPIYRISSGGGSPIYGRAFFHGGNQFSYATLTNYRQGTPSAAQLYVTPFQVNQSTGAITVGTGTAVINDTVSGTEISTTLWGHAGSHAWALSYCGRHYIAAWTVANNTVSGIQTQVVGARDNVGTPRAYTSINSNEDASCTRVGSTSYFAPGTRNFNSSAGLIGAYDYVWSYNGTSLTLVRDNALDATNTNGSQWHHTLPFTPQYSANVLAGTAAATRGFRQFNKNEGAPMFQTLDSTCTPVNTYNGNTLFNGSANIVYPNGLGFELSDGTALVGFQDATWLRISSSNVATNVSETVNTKVMPPAARGRYGWAQPVAQDTWWVGNVVTPVEMCKIYINPSTLETTYLDSFNMNNGWKTQNRAQSAYTNGSLFMTGTDKQFFCTVSNMEGQHVGSARIKVIAHGRKGN